MTDLIEQLRAIRPKLKSGEYDGADIMEAWCVAESAADRIAALEKAGETLCAALDAIDHAKGQRPKSSECEICAVLNAYSRTLFRLTQETKCEDGGSHAVD